MSNKVLTGRLAIILKLTLALVLLFFVIFVVFLYTFDINNYRDELQNRASSSLGRDIILEGPLSMGHSLVPTIVIEKIHISNPKWASRPYLASVDVLELEVELLPLFREELKVNSIKIKNMDVLLEKNKQGEPNWQFAGSESKQRNKAVVDIGSIELENTSLSYGTAGKIIKTLRIDEATLKITSSLLNRETVYDLSKLKAMLNESDFSGAVSYTQPNDGRPLLVANIKSDKFVYEDIVANSQAKKTKKPASGTRRIPDIKFPVKHLQSIDAKLDFAFGKFVVGDVEYEDVLAHAKLQNGKLLIDPLNASLAGGKLRSKVKLDAHASAPTVSINLEGDDVDHGGLLATFGMTDKVTGKADVKIDLQGVGANTRTLLAKANGRIDIVSGEGQIDQAELGLWASDLIATALTSAWKPKKASKVNCTIAKIDIRDGIASSDILLLDTEELTVAVSGKLNLGNEELNLLLAPSPKSPSFISLAKPVQVTGNLADPKVAVATSSKTKILGGLLTGLTNPAAILLLYGDTGKGVASSNPCLDIGKRVQKKKSEKQQQPLDPDAADD